VKNLCLALLLAAATNVLANDAGDALVRTEQAAAQAVVDLDFETMDRIYADDFQFHHSTGVVETKDDWLNMLRNTDSPYTSRKVDEIEVELHGDIAITSGRLTIKRDIDNPRFQDFRVWYIRVYEYRSERWQMISHRSIREATGPFTEIP
jgi:ketosteroid isomerase-like protein